nr:venom protein U-MPTX.15-39 [Megalopyge opercularis]
MTSNKFDLLLFFDRPSEPCFMNKGEDKAVFQIPDTYYPEKYKKASSQIANRFGTGARIIPVKNIALPDLTLPKQLNLQDQFSLWIPKHREMAGKLIDILMNMRDIDDLMSISSYCQMNINPYMFNYCLSVAILHRPDTKGINLPTFVEVFPDKFMDPKVFRRAREVATVVPAGTRNPIVIPQNYTASDAEPEQRVAYFREDIGINLHHWHWHLVYPFDGDRAIVNKDRRGELFYYMHHQIICRYTTARFCNNLGQVVRYNDFRSPITEGYFPKMDSFVASRTWPPRFAGTRIRDLDRPVDQIRIDVSQLEDWRARIMQVVESGTFTLTNGRSVALDEDTGIDVLGNMLESSIISPNRTLYGDLHNMGHVFISYAHDPDHRHLEQFGVMGDSTTAMRDPVFYRWHAYIDDIFETYKQKLQPYGSAVLDFPGIRAASVRVQSQGSTNTFNTFWQKSTVDLARGLDFTPRGSVLAQFTHLQHEEFDYVIDVVNSTGQSVMGTVRIFMAAITDESGRKLTFDEQRKLMIELDKFTTQLNPGNNTVTRKSTLSTVTIPFEQSFRNQADRPGDPGSTTAAEFDFCGCGWPHHMLIPKGTIPGYPVMLFAMISNWNNDRVEQERTNTKCKEASSFCGLRDRKYPDRRAMGFPFDRPAAKNVNNLTDFLLPNMAVQQCSIKFTDTVRIRSQR